MAYERYGRSPAEVLRQGQITPAMLRDQRTRITARQMEALSEGAMRELDDEALGWFSRRLPWGTLGMLCRASLPSHSLEVALKRWCRHHRLLVEDVTLELHVAGGRATLSILEHTDLGAVREFCLLSLLRYVHGFACWAVDSRISLLGVGFPFPRPPHGEVYPLLFPGPVSFEAERAHLTMDARYLALPLPRDDRDLRVMLAHALPLTVLPYRRDRLLVQRVRRFLSEHPGESHRADAIARHLHVSLRSLHRHLREEGASLQRIKDDVRRERAETLLVRTGDPVKQVARAVGFSDEKAFARAFKSWTGETPRGFRVRASSR
jgi:AraC-like DNA-binding protein